MLQVNVALSFSHSSDSSPHFPSSQRLEQRSPRAFHSTVASTSMVALYGRLGQRDKAEVG